MTSKIHPRSLRPLSLLAFAGVCLVLSGCHKQQKVMAATAPPPPPVEMITVPPPTHVTPDATFDYPPAPPVEEPTKPATPPPRRPKAVTPPPAVVAPTPAPPVSIGVFSGGGDVTPQMRSDTAALLNNVHTRVNRLSSQEQTQHRDQLQRIQNFLKQADDAWKSGDVDGARTLATKANVLLDDIRR